MSIQTVSALDPHDAPPRTGGLISQLKLQLGVASDSVAARPSPPVFRERTNSSKSGGSVSLLFKDDARKASRFKEPTNIHLSPLVLREPTRDRKHSAPGFAPVPTSNTYPFLSPDQIRSRRAYSVRTTRERRYMRAERALACTIRHCDDVVSSGEDQDSLELQRVRALEHALALLGTHAEIAKARIQELRACLADRDVDPAERDKLLKERWAVEKRGKEIDRQIQVLAEANKGKGDCRSSRVKPKPKTPSSSQSQPPIEKGSPSAPFAAVSPSPGPSPASSSAPSSSSSSSGPVSSSVAPTTSVGPDAEPRGTPSANPSARDHEDGVHRRAANLAAFFARSATHTPLNPRLPPGLGPNPNPNPNTSTHANTDTLTTQWDAYIHSTYTRTTHDPRTAFLPRRISLSDVSPIRLRPSSVPSPFDRAHILSSQPRLARGPGGVLNRPASFDTHTRRIQMQKRLALSPSLSAIPDSQSAMTSAGVQSKVKVKGQASMPLLNINLKGLQAPGAGAASNPPPRPERSPRRMSSTQPSPTNSNNSASLSTPSSHSSALTTPVPSPAPHMSGPVAVAAPTPSTMALSGGWDASAIRGSAKIYSSPRPRSVAELLSTTDLGEIRIPSYALSLLDSFDDIPSDIRVALGEEGRPSHARPRARTQGQEAGGEGRPSHTLGRRSSASYVRVTAPRTSDLVDGYLAVNGNGNGPHPTFCIPNSPTSPESPNGGAASPGVGLRKRLSQVRLRPKRSSQFSGATNGGGGAGGGNSNRHSLLVYMRKRMGSEGEGEDYTTDETATATAPPTPVPDAQAPSAAQTAEDTEREEREKEREKKERMKESSFTKPLKRRFGAFWGGLW